MAIIKGKWKWQPNDSIILDDNYNGIVISFVSNGQSFEKLAWYWTTGIWCISYIAADGIEVAYRSCPSPEIADENPNYQIIDFGDTEQEISDEVYTFIMTHAIVAPIPTIDFLYNVNMTQALTAEGDVTINGVLTGAESQALSEASIALGKKTQAGIKGFYWRDMVNSYPEFGEDGNPTGRTLIELYLTALTPDQTPTTIKDVLTPEQIAEYFLPGDILTIHAGNKYDKQFEVKEYNYTNHDSNLLIVGTIDSAIFTNNNKYKEGMHFTDNAVFCPAKPNAGLVDFGKGAFAMGESARATNFGTAAFGRDTEAYGQYSMVAGRDTSAGYAAFADGRFAHAEGPNSVATGLRAKATAIGAHAEGGSEAGNTATVDSNWTVAMGKFSHAEGGSTKALGDFSHTEGNFTTASGARSHAEGYNTQTGAGATGAHAEGINTKALGAYSHTEGEGTVSTRSSQHVQGRYNALDADDNSSVGAFIIGGGTDANNRKDIHRVDWQGNAWYASDVVAGSISLHRTSETAAKAQSTADTAKNTAETANNHIGLHLVKANDATGGAKGLGASSTASYGAALGWRCAVTGGHGMAFGACLTAAGGQTAFGKANAPAQKYKNASGENKTAIFMIGNGSTDTGGNVTNPSNAFAVLSDGTGYLGNKKILVEGDIPGGSGDLSEDITVNTIAIGDIGQTTIGAFRASFAGDVNITGDVNIGGDILMEQNNNLASRVSIAYQNRYAGHIALDNCTWGTGFTVDGYGDAHFGSVEDYGFGSGVKIYGMRGEIEADNSITASNYITASAGITEMYEWTDGNANNEDRRGLFITLDGGKIRIANENDTYILGVIDPNPSLIGDAAGLEWKDKYLKDVFGSYIYEEVEVPAKLDEDGNVLEEATTRMQRVLNPEYDETQEYIARTDRKEFAAITSKGKVIMIDDGTCVVNGYATVGVNGQATYSSDNYAVRVLERINETHIKVLIDSIFVK